MKKEIMKTNLKIIGTCMFLSLLLLSFGCEQKGQVLNTTNNTLTTMPPVNVLQTANDTVLNENFEYSGKAKVIPVTMSTGRYAVTFLSDKPMLLRVYDESHYVQWNTNGIEGTAKLSTLKGYNTPEDCCTAEGAWMIDINQGEEGNYYFVFEDRLNVLPTRGRITATKMYELN
jgi:hypothetical protein